MPNRLIRLRWSSFVSAPRSAPLLLWRSISPPAESRTTTAACTTQPLCRPYWRRGIWGLAIWNQSDSGQRHYANIPAQWAHGVGGACVSQWPSRWVGEGLSGCVWLIREAEILQRINVPYNAGLASARMSTSLIEAKNFSSFEVFLCILLPLLDPHGEQIDRVDIKYSLPCCALAFRLSLYNNNTRYIVPTFSPLHGRTGSYTLFSSMSYRKPGYNSSALHLHQEAGDSAARVRGSGVVWGRLPCLLGSRSGSRASW